MAAVHSGDVRNSALQGLWQDFRGGDGAAAIRSDGWAVLCRGPSGIFVPVTYSSVREVDLLMLTVAARSGCDVVQACCGMDG
jgi:hypothetical protein